MIGWEIQTTDVGVVNLGIFRNASETEFTVVGTSMVDATAGGHHFLELAMSAWIVTEPGDVIGVFYPNVPTIVPAGGGMAEEYMSRVFAGARYSALTNGEAVTVTPKAAKQTVAVRAILAPLSGESLTSYA